MYLAISVFCPYIALSILITCFLYVAGYKKTYFVIQTPQGITWELIHYDDSFVSDKIAEAMDKYRNIVIPEFFEQKFVRDLVLPNL